MNILKRPFRILFGIIFGVSAIVLNVLTWIFQPEVRPRVFNKYFLRDVFYLMIGKWE